MKSNLFVFLLALLCAFACSDQLEKESINLSETSGVWGSTPELVMTLDELLSTPGVFKFEGPENRIYLMKDGSMSKSQDDYDNAIKVEVIYSNNVTDIITLGDGKDYVLDFGIWHEIVSPCGYKTWYETSEEYFDLCDANSYRCCTRTIRWSCLAPYPIKISESYSCGDCKPFDPWHPHYPCGFQR
ncbi:hypothetical protein [Ekhidna sp.]